MLGLVLCVPALAKKKGGGGGDKPDDSSGTTVSSVDAASNKVTLSVQGPPSDDGKPAEKKDIVYTVELGATIKVNGNLATLNDVHEGQKVTNYTEGDEGVLVELDVEN
ncbi:MAG TPA: hypothetical protein VL981_00675 [Candidatus Methylacidiphilales bacterium]|nr:hypothetical protein [Candidatus Methylacidiphilales bacterium]